MTGGLLDTGSVEKGSGVPYGSVAVSRIVVG